MNFCHCGGLLPASYQLNSGKPSQCAWLAYFTQIGEELKFWSPVKMDLLVTKGFVYLKDRNVFFSRQMSLLKWYKKLNNIPLSFCSKNLKISWKVFDFADTDTVVSRILRRILHKRISPRNQKHIRKYLEIWLRGLDGLERWNNAAVNNLVTLSLF